MPPTWGERAGREVVQLYLRDVAADVTRPLLELADWVSLVLDAGAIGTATFTVTPAQLSYYDRTMTLRIDLAKPSSRSVRTPSAAPRPGSR